VAKIISLKTSKATGIAKQPVDSISVQPDHGFTNDAHARDWQRQISLLAMEIIQKMTGENPELRPDSFVENITPEGIELKKLALGTRPVSGRLNLRSPRSAKNVTSSAISTNRPATA